MAVAIQIIVWLEPDNTQKLGETWRVGQVEGCVAIIWIAALQMSPSELTIDIKDEPEEIRSEPAPPGMD
jgi:hypothetical protein